jgi:hypothetical protein
MLIRFFSGAVFHSPESHDERAGAEKISFQNPWTIKTDNQRRNRHENVEKDAADWNYRLLPAGGLCYPGRR